MVSSGLQDWSPVPEGNSEQGLGTGAQALTRAGPVAERVLLFFHCTYAVLRPVFRTEAFVSLGERRC